MSRVLSVSKSAEHKFSKDPVEAIVLLEGLGVEGDAHAGTSVQHRSRMKKTPSEPNLRQVHLIHDELLQGLRAKGFAVNPGSLGENITTSGIDLLSLPLGTVLKLGSRVELEVTGLRNPCAQLDHYQTGLTAAVLDRDEQGNLLRKSGIMSVVRKGGTVSCGDEIAIHFPAKPHVALTPV